MKNICCVLIFALFLSITPYDYLLSKADSIAHAATPPTPAPTLHDAFDNANATWTWHHEDQDGGRWAITNTIDYYDATGAKTSHTIEYGQQAADGDTTFSVMAPLGDHNRSIAGGYWFKLEKFDSSDQSGENIYVYIKTPAEFNPAAPQLNNPFSQITFGTLTDAYAKKVYSLYFQSEWANKPIGGTLGRDAVRCADNTPPHKLETVIVPDREGYDHVPLLVTMLWDGIFGNPVDDVFTNSNVSGKCLLRVGANTATDYQIADTSTAFHKYLAQTSNYLNGITTEASKPSVTEQTLTEAEVAPCKDLLIDPVQAKKDFLVAFPAALDMVLANAVDNAGNDIIIDSAKRQTLVANVSKAFTGDLDNENIANSAIPSIDTITLYQQFYGSYGVKNQSLSGYPTAPSAQYPNAYYDTNMRLADKQVMTTLEDYTKVKPENSNKPTDIDMNKSLAKAAKSAAKDDPKLLTGLVNYLQDTPITTAAWEGAGVATMIIFYKTGLLSKVATSMFGGLITSIQSYTIMVGIKIGAGLEAFFGTIAVAIFQICVILAAVLIGVAVVLWGMHLLRQYWKSVYTRAYYASFYSWWLGTKAADFHTCMVNNSVGKGSLTTAKAAAIGLSAANIANEKTNLDLTKGDLAKESATVAADQTDDSCGCGVVSGSSIMNILKRSFCAVICWTFNVGKGLQENATCLFNDALGTIQRKTTPTTTRDASIGCAP